MLERRSSFGLSIDPPARTTLLAWNFLARPVTVLRTKSSNPSSLFCTFSTKWLRSSWRTGLSPSVAFAGIIGGKPQLVDKQLGRVEHAGGFGEEFFAGAEVRLKVWLVQSPGRFLDVEIGREPRVLEPRHYLLGHAAHRLRLVHFLAGVVEEAPLDALES